ncbi:MAG TPA: class I SAM-dependent methyltransferase [Sphingomicrobium sp.]|nr:class I SAM-dependent methyltransferase [Sphingomicrobium sp.]
MLETAQLPVLDPAEAYSLWAPTYDRETAVSLLDNSLVSELTPPLPGRRLLDVGCGTARRLIVAGAASATGVEPCREMIAAGAVNAAGRAGVRILEGHAGNLPVGDGSFDVIWCRLVLGHIAGLAAPYSEMARALAVGGTLVVSDFHPDAEARGHRRTFRSASGVHEITNYAHSIADHAAVAGRCGLAFVDQSEGRVGPPVRHLYAERGRLADYEHDMGIPLVFALRFERR